MLRHNVIIKEDQWRVIGSRLDGSFTIFWADTLAAAMFGARQFDSARIVCPDGARIDVTAQSPAIVITPAQIGD
jgi:hypothetical protein